MKVLFLDIDGVCNSAATLQRDGGLIGIDPEMAFRVRKIVKVTGCKVVLSSTWRLSKEGIARVEANVIELYGTTPNLPGNFRGDEVRAWLEQNPNVTKYAILDDDNDFWKDQPLFKTKWKTGLTEQIANKVINHLKDI